MNSIMQRLKKISYIRKGVKTLKGLKYSIGAKYYCPVCNRKINRFHPLPKFYSNNAKKHGYPYIGKAETLNYQNFMPNLWIKRPGPIICIIHSKLFRAHKERYPDQYNRHCSIRSSI